MVIYCTDFRLKYKGILPVKILLLDDEQNILRFMEKMLDRLGHVVDCTSDAGKAVEMIETGNYDFALIDYMMPVHDGVWFLKTARVPNNTKVLLMTGHVDRDIIKEMLRLGARGYLIKPLEKEELLIHFAFYSNGSSQPSAPAQQIDG
jgi:DNA-binding response OmpR family regulator